MVGQGYVNWAWSQHIFPLVFSFSELCEFFSLGKKKILKINKILCWLFVAYRNLANISPLPLHAWPFSPLGAVFQLHLIPGGDRWFSSLRLRAGFVHPSKMHLPSSLPSVSLPKPRHLPWGIFLVHPGRVPRLISVVTQLLLYTPTVECLLY